MGAGHSSLQTTLAAVRWAPGAVEGGMGVAPAFIGALRSTLANMTTPTPEAAPTNDMVSEAGRHVRGGALEAGGQACAASRNAFALPVD